MAAALAAASRALKTADPALAGRALAAAKSLWQAQRSRLTASDTSDGRDGQGNLAISDASATIELLMATQGEATYRTRLEQLLPTITRNFGWIGASAVLAIPFMGADYKAQLIPAVRAAKAQADALRAKNPFAVPIGEGSWAGSHQVAEFGSDMYLLHRAFPDIVGTEYTLDAIDYLLGRHPANNLSLVSTVGTQSKLIGYGHNRADYSFIPGGLVPGVLIIKPDFPELKTDWPFLWYENEYTVSTTSQYILAANAAVAATKER
jgi:hypothetical protein